MRIRSRPESSAPVMVNSGAVRPTSHESVSSNPTRMNIARNRPIRRAFSRSAGGSLSTRIEMKMMLSMPSTSSSAVNVKKAIQTWGSERIVRRASIDGRHIRGKSVADPESQGNEPDVAVGFAVDDSAADAPVEPRGLRITPGQRETHAAGVENRVVHAGYVERERMPTDGAPDADAVLPVDRALRLREESAHQRLDSRAARELRRPRELDEP